MPIADLLPSRFGPAGRLPGHLGDLKGPAKGVVMLPMHLSWPGMRECDVSVDRARRSMYGMLLSQGKRNDIVRFVNAGLLVADWPAIAESLDPRLRRRCERQFGLGAADEATGEPARTGEATAGVPPVTDDGAGASRTVA
ncbi:MAG TPA: hypothetical protein VMA95_11065 [Streptosporangiaceae bacterium]|nr:hypothetical protein [Streptosporangiaceae bacterium]